MGTRTVRFFDETEQTLEEIREMKGLSIRRGLQARHPGLPGDGQASFAFSY